MGAVAIWNDITPEGRANFYEWHGRQHIPERVGIPGFLTGRRYVALAGAPAYFTLYEATDLAVLKGPGYAARLNAPTDWTLQSTAHFRNVARALCAVEQSVGSGWGGLIATWRYEVDAPRAEVHAQAIAGLIPDLATRTGVAGAHALVTDMGASGVDNAERRRRGEPNAVPGRVLMVEGWDDPPAFAGTCGKITAQLFGRDGKVAPWADYGLYQFQSSLYRAS